MQLRRQSRNEATRNEATKQRRTAIKEYWRKKTEDLKNNPKAFFKTFKPFLSTKGCTERENIHLNVNGNVIKDQTQVAEVLVEHFATLADGIGGAAAERNSMEDFKDHPVFKRSNRSMEPRRKTSKSNLLRKGSFLLFLNR